MFSTFAQQINTRLNTLAEQELFVTLPGDDLWTPAQEQGVGDGRCRDLEERQV